MGETEKIVAIKKSHPLNLSFRVRVVLALKGSHVHSLRGS